MIRISHLLFLLILSGDIWAQDPLWFTDAEGRHLPRISAHRGGRFIPGYPENAIATFEQTLAATPAMIECDVSMTADSVLILMHDNTLDRTTTGSGRVDQQRWESISTLKLEDDFGALTDYSVPRLDATLRWAGQKKAVLTLDVKRGVPFDKVLAEVRAAGIKEQIVVITYNVRDAQTVYNLDPEIRISASIRNIEELQRIDSTGIPARNLLAFTGTTLSSKELYEALRAKQIPAMLGTLGNLDKQAEAQGPHIYREFLAFGVDILATDRPVAVRGALEN